MFRCADITYSFLDFGPDDLGLDFGGGCLWVFFLLFTLNVRLHPLGPTLDPRSGSILNYGSFCYTIPEYEKG